MMNGNPSADRDRAGGPLPNYEFFHPIPLTAITVMAINDHALKGSGLFPAWVTGKLSDICGMIFFPLFFTAVTVTLLWGLDRLLL
jgi:hypothetical protein